MEEVRRLYPYVRQYLPLVLLAVLASSSTSNVRELEGMLIRLGAYASLTGNEITLSNES